jgi:diguanylate cyclase (GGDEF)-like protein
MSNRLDNLTIILSRRKIDAASTACVFAVSVSTLALVGWALDIEPLKRIFPGMVAMNPTTAVSFMLLSISLWLSRPEKTNRRTMRLTWVCGGLVVLVGYLKLGELLFGWTAGIDQWLFTDKLASDPSGQPNRMAPNTALNFLLQGCALLLLHVKTRRGSYLAQMFVGVSIFASLLPVIGYIYGMKPFYGVGSFIPMALHTAVTFLALSIGIMFVRPGSGLTKTIFDEGVSGIMVRRLLPAVIILPIILGWLRLQGQRLGFYDNEFGVALTVMLHIVILTMLIWWNSFLLLGIDARRKQAEKQLQDLTLTDDLTVLRNRRGFLLLADQELKLIRQRHLGMHLWLIYADMDGLKQINDTLGHEAGSQAIVQVSKILKESFRESDILARLGGDEFAVLSIGSDPEGGNIMLARLQENLRAFNVQGKLPYPLAVSAGIVRIDPEQAASIETVINEADQAMYEHKRNKKMQMGLNPSLNNRLA